MTAWLAVFVISALADMAWAIYTRHVVLHHAVPAAVWSAIIMLIVGFNTIAYTENHWLIVPAVAGAFVGTYVAVKR